MAKKNDLPNDRLSIVIVSFDGYKDIWPYFFQAFERYWSDCTYAKYLINNNEIPIYKNTTVINTGNETTWCNRTKRAIEKIDSEYVLLLLEDYLIGSKVENSNINQAMKFIAENDSKYFRITNIPNTRSSQEIMDNIFPIYENEEYGVNLQAAIWKRDYLIKILNEVNGSAWDFEIHFLKKAIVSQESIMSGCYVDTKNIIDVHNGVLKGKWFPKEIKYFKNRGIIIDSGDRGELTRKQVITHNVKFNVRESISYNLRKKIKKLLSRLGVKFVTKY